MLKIWQSLQIDQKHINVITENYIFQEFPGTDFFKNDFYHALNTDLGVP